MSEVGHERDRTKLLIHEYDLFVGLFKTYCDLVIKLVTGFFAISGAILSYYLKNAGPQSHLVLILLLPVTVSLLLASFFKTGAAQADQMKTAVDGLRDSLHLDGRGPHIEILAKALRGVSLVLLVLGCVLFLYMILEMAKHGVSL